MTTAVIRFPGTNNESDVIRALRLIPGGNPYLARSREGAEALKNADAIVIPGGFSYGDYLRAGAVASVEDIMEGVRDFALSGKPVLGICNGFQILTEAGLLPGSLLHNEAAHFICKWVYVKVSEETTVFTQHLENAVLRLPIAHAEGNYYCHDDDLAVLNSGGRVVFRYCDSDGKIVPEANPNGSIDNIAGIINERGNVLGMMPHPDRAYRQIIGSEDGLSIIENFVRAAKER